MTEPIKLNLGCGAIRPAGWINTDSSLNMLLQQVPFVGSLIPKLAGSRAYTNGNAAYMNLNGSWKRFGDGSVDVVYASHVLEHLSTASAAGFAREAFRCLKPGGGIRIVVPDLFQLCKNYVEAYGRNEPVPADHLLWAINMHREGQYAGKLGWLHRMVLEWQGYPHQHKFMYDARTLTRLLVREGFIDARELEYGSSGFIEDIQDLEAGDEPYLSVYLEAKKPIA